ncbi:MAG: family 20 glycosylhydrolase [Pyrinomonadaceae bacterium]
MPKSLIIIRLISPVMFLLCGVFVLMSQESAAQQIPQHNLMPVPAMIKFNTGKLSVTKSFNIAVKGQSDERLKSYIDRVIKRMEGRTVLEFSRELSSDAPNASLVIECGSTGKLIPALGEDESYNLEINDKQARLNAPTTVGAMRGLETFLQLLDENREGYFVPAVSIQDKPRFPWRGLMIDIARHFQPMDVLKRNIDGMAAVKLNVLHWHLTDDQGFRVESKKFPRLHQMGSDGLFYTQDQIREIIAYARDRGIRVVPEFDMPGHATAWLVGHPELGSAPGPYKIERGAGIFDPALDPTREEVYQFLDGFLGEMAALFPDAYLHIGGDENEGKQWDKNPQIQAFMRDKGFKDHHALQTYFNQRLLKILQKHGKTMMGWDEIFQPDLPKDVVIHSWRGQKALVEAARQGYQSILSNGYYIDLIYPASQHYAVDPLPADSGLTEEEQKRILGGEATMWSEWVSPETIDSRIWPRTAAIAERFWSPREVKDTADMYRRLAVIDAQLEELGLTHRKNQAMMLRRLANNKDSDALQTLASLVEPVKEYKRYQVRPQTMLSPLTGLVDAAHPDSETARVFALLVNEMLSDAPKFQNGAAKIQNTLTKWQTAGTELVPLTDSLPGLQEAKPLASDLSEIGAIGLESLSFLARGVAPPDGWRDSKLAALKQIANPKAGLEFPIVPSLREMVIAASELPNLKNMSQSEWREQVRKMAALNASPQNK